MDIIATDVGGTFTDLVHFDGNTGKLYAVKNLSTPDNFGDGVMTALELSEAPPERIQRFIHGGTTVINAVTERKGVKTALVTTRGFRDVLEIARGNRPDLYNLRFEKPPVFVPRYLRFEADERVRADGSIDKKLDPETLADIVTACRKEGVEALAIVFLHSYLEPSSEVAAASYFREHMPDVSVVASHEITREWREYERSNTTVLNAYVQPIIQDYFEGLEQAIRQKDVSCALTAMQSNGGTTSFENAKKHPIMLVESGPAAGINGAAVVCRLLGIDSALYLEVGGTTAKAATIEGAEPKVKTEYYLEKTRINPGYPLMVPVVDLVEIGSGGGSIASIDDGGRLRVGPQSAGSKPGPASYGLGGTQPTVTDSKLLAGVLNPKYFAGGQFDLDEELAFRSFSEISSYLGVTPQQAAVSVIKVAESEMLSALRLVSVQRGIDPREMPLIAAGGGGAMHAVALGRELGVSKVIIPPLPGYFSAWGMVATVPKVDFSQTNLRLSSELSDDEALESFNRMKVEATDYLEAILGSLSAPITFLISVDMRYYEQQHTIPVSIDPDDLSVNEIVRLFHEAHQTTYGFSMEHRPAEFVTFKLTARAEIQLPELPKVIRQGKTVYGACKGTRVIWTDLEKTVEAAIYERDELPIDVEIAGPAVIEEPSTVSLIGEQDKFWIDDRGLLHIVFGN